MTTAQPPHYIETPEETAARIEYLETTAHTIRALHTERKQIYWDIGAKLLEARGYYPAAWLSWVKQELPFSHDTATRLMRVASTLPRPVNTTNELPKAVAYALTKAPEAVRNMALTNGVQNAATVQLLVSVYRNRDENDDYREMLLFGGWVNAHDETIKLNSATPADCREYRTAKQSARFHTYQISGTIKRVDDTLVIHGAVIPSDLADGQVRIVISREIEK